MNTMRRRANLEKKVQAIEEEIARQEKARQGVESLFKVYQEQPDFCDEKGAEDVNRQLVEVCMCACVLCVCVRVCCVYVCVMCV